MGHASVVMVRCPTMGHELSTGVEMGPVVGYAVVLVLFTAASVQAAELGTAQEAKAMLEKAVVAVKEDKAKALEMFNKGEGGFKDRDLYVWCANASDGILTAHPTYKGKELRDIEGKHALR